MRKPLMAGNWKMYKTEPETVAFFEKFCPMVAEDNGRDVVICPPFPNLAVAVKAAQGSRIEIGGQNLFWAKEGAYTGEVSAAMLRAVGCRWVIIGHSERRQYFGETDESVFKKTVAAIEMVLIPIVCIGELLKERESGQTMNVLQRQFRGGLGGLQPAQLERVVIAYEPVWAIGTGRTATPEIAAGAHRTIRGEVARQFGEETASRMRILYGGSVKPDNINGLMAQEEIDGVLVGGASLDPDSFAKIVNF